MLPTSHSAQNFQSPGLTVQPPPRSRSTVNLQQAAGNTVPGQPKSSAGNPGGRVAPATYSGPSFLRSTSTSASPASPSGHPTPPGTSQPAYTRTASAGAAENTAVPPSPRYTSTHSARDGPPNQYLHSSTRTGQATSFPSSPAHAPTPPHLSHLSSYDSRMVANTINKIESSSGLGALMNAPSTAAPGSSGGQNVTNSGADSDAWTAVCIRTLPLFNGEGQRGYIEDLNDLISTHIRRTIERMGKTATAISSLANDLIDLLAMGMLTLNAKLADLSDDRLLVRITEVWNFFFIGCLPFIEGICLPLRTDPTLRAIVASSNTSAPGRSLSFSSNTIKTTEAIDIRWLALRSFRDHLVLPIVDRLAVLFASEPNSSTAHPAEPSSRPGTTSNVSSTSRTAAARRLQMTSILISIQSNDERQAATAALGKALRAGMEQLQPDQTVSPAPGALASGMYGAAFFSHTTRGAKRPGKQADKRSWRHGKQLALPLNRQASQASTDSRLQFASNASESNRPHGAAFQTEHERRFPQRSRSSGTSGISQVNRASPLTSRDVPEVAVMD